LGCQFFDYDLSQFGDERLDGHILSDVAADRLDHLGRAEIDPAAERLRFQELPDLGD